MIKRKPYYGVIGNGKTCALISPSGSIDWLCLPNFDGKIFYAKGLDPAHGGSCEMNVSENERELLVYSARQKYLGKTNVLSTKINFKDASLELIDFMPWKENYLIRLATLKNKSKRRRSLALQTETTIARLPIKKYKEIRGRTILYNKEGLTVGVSFQGRQPEEIELKAFEETTIPIIFAYGSSRKEVEGLLNRKFDARHKLKVCRDFWENWIDRGKKVSFENKDYENMYYRSLLLLKLMTFNQSGAILAAPTASFPAVPGGTDNWDYRFTWIRDAYFVCQAFLRSGHYDEVKKQLNFFYRLQKRSGHWSSPFYTITGETPKKEIIIEELRGPNQEEIIRINNEARNQLQLDSEGSVLHATYLYYLFTHQKNFLRYHWKRIKRAADWIARNFHREENGIWEAREKRAHWVYGKVLCFVGLESAIKIAEVLKERRHSIWLKAVRELKKDIIRQGWSPQRQAFLQTYDSDSPVDVSALAIEWHGLLSPKDPRIKKTVKLIESKLYVDGGIKRFEEAVYPFYLPTLWLAGHYTLLGDTREAKKYIKKCIDSATNLYLCAEHFDPRNKEQCGNFPQSFCASEFVLQIINLTHPKELPRITGLFQENIKSLLRLFERLSPKSRERIKMLGVEAIFINWRNKKWA